MNKSNKPFTVSLHIPKTAGTTLESILLKQYGDRLYRYNFEPELLKTKKADWILENYDAIHGHFDINEFDLSAEGIRSFCFVRDPYDRVVSHFKYYNQNFIEGPFSEKVHSGEVGFEAFAFSENMKNLQCRMMGQYVVDDFDLVGNSKDFNSYIPSIEQLINARSKHAAIEQLNVSVKGSNGVNKPTENFMERFKKHHARDYEMFKRACTSTSAKAA